MKIKILPFNDAIFQLLLINLFIWMLASIACCIMETLSRLLKSINQNFEAHFYEFLTWRCIIICLALSKSPLAIERQYLISIVVLSGNISCKRSYSSMNKSQFESVDPLPSLVSDKCWILLICPVLSVHSVAEVGILGWRPRNFSSGIRSFKLKVLKNSSILILSFTLSSRFALTRSSKWVCHFLLAHLFSRVETRVQRSTYKSCLDRCWRNRKNKPTSFLEKLEKLKIN